MSVGSEHQVGRDWATRTLALEIRSGRFAFAILQSDDPLEWGTRSFPSGPDGKEIAVKKLAFLLKLYSPHFVTARRTRRTKDESSENALRILAAIRRELEHRRIPFLVLARDDVHEFFAAQGYHTKHEIASYIASRFPSLQSNLPRPRKKWEPERWIVAVFDAIGTGIAAAKDQAPQ